MSIIKKIRTLKDEDKFNELSEWAWRASGNGKSDEYIVSILKEALCYFRVGGVMFEALEVTIQDYENRE